MSPTGTSEARANFPLASSGRPPVIIFGMHRSGTGALAQCLAHVGLMIGRRLDDNHESMLFQGLNRQVFSRAGAAWDHPLPVRNLTNDPSAVTEAARRFRLALNSHAWASYAGWGGYIAAGGPEAIRRPWGWKDPRTAFTLKIWLELFPEAMIIHVIRHGVDVARSLQLRETERAEKVENASLARQVASRRRGRPVPISHRCRDLEGGLALWTEYLTETQTFWPRLGETAIALRFEDLLAEPLFQLQALSHRAGLSPTQEQLEEAAAMLDATRSLAFRSDPDLEAFSSRHSEQLSRFGYAL